jgi:hypothetical protein
VLPDDAPQTENGILTDVDPDKRNLDHADALKALLGRMGYVHLYP